MEINFIEFVELNLQKGDNKMTKYICDKCGITVEFGYNKQDKGICPICQGKLIIEHDMQEKEEIARLTDEDTKDDDLTPKQDAEEAVIEFLTFAMQKNLREVGNDRTYHFIEEITKAETRAKHRKFFILAGGYIPLCEPIIIK